MAALAVAFYNDRPEGAVESSVIRNAAVYVVGFGLAGAAYFFTARRFGPRLFARLPRSGYVVVGVLWLLSLVLLYGWLVLGGLGLELGACPGPSNFFGCGEGD